MFFIKKILQSALLSLSHNWNIASVVIESFWILISFIGVVKYFQRK